jgi:hypothetical protein
MRTFNNQTGYHRRECQHGIDKDNNEVGRVLELALVEILSIGFLQVLLPCVPD